MALQVPLPTLLALPKELRLEIYTTLYPATPSESPIPLLPLSYNLLHTSKQIYLECLPTYIACYNDYYSASKFTLSVHGSSDTSPEVEQQITSISEKDFNRITNLTITVRPTLGDSSEPKNESENPENNWIFTLVHPYGGWRITRPPGPPGKFVPGVVSDEDGGRVLTWRRFRPWVTRVSPGSSETVIAPTKASGGGLRGHVLELVKTDMAEY
nr:hypothetical protein B0A51_09192 [Rachicladosporium sp. CCFEE 5018]